MCKDYKLSKKFKKTAFHCLLVFKSAKNRRRSCFEASYSLESCNEKLAFLVAFLFYSLKKDVGILEEFNHKNIFRKLFISCLDQIRLIMQKNQCTAVSSQDDKKGFLKQEFITREKLDKHENKSIPNKYDVSGLIKPKLENLKTSNKLFDKKIEAKTSREKCNYLIDIFKLIFV